MLAVAGGVFYGPEQDFIDGAQRLLLTGDATWQPFQRLIVQAERTMPRTGQELDRPIGQTSSASAVDRSDHCGGISSMIPTASARERQES